MPVAGFSKYETSSDKIKASMSDCIYIRNSMQLSIQGFTLNNNIPINTKLDFRLGVNTSTLIVDD